MAKSLTQKNRELRARVKKLETRINDLEHSLACGKNLQESFNRALMEKIQEVARKLNFDILANENLGIFNILDSIVNRVEIERGQAKCCKVLLTNTTARLVFCLSEDLGVVKGIAFQEIPSLLDILEKELGSVRKERILTSEIYELLLLPSMIETSNIDKIKSIQERIQELMSNTYDKDTIDGMLTTIIG